MSEDLDAMRAEIRALDRRIIDLTAERIALARRIGERKREAGLPIRNYEVEADVIRLARDAAAHHGLRPGTAEEMVKLLIQESLRVQERDRVGRRHQDGTAGTAIVVGGAGNMGRWFVEYLESKRFTVRISDPLSESTRALKGDLVAAAADADLVLFATPPSVTADVMPKLAGLQKPLVLDISSLKAPVESALRGLADSGVRVASIHPMWGPATDLLAGRNVLICDCGDAEAAREARALFEDTAARIVDMPLSEHDAVMADTLGLPHALNLIYGRALERGHRSFADLTGLGGPTFQKQNVVASEVASENKDLYYEIQRLNPHTADVLARLRESLDELEAALAARPDFRAYMASSAAYFQARTGGSS